MCFNNREDFRIEDGVLIEYCGKRKNIKIPDDVLEINNANEYYQKNFNENVKSVKMTDSVLKIQSATFSLCINMKKVKLSKNLTVIESILFNDCKSLKKIEIPKKVKTIEDGAFENCTKLKKVKLYKGIEIIQNRAFKNCTSLKEIEIPKTVRSIGEEAFADCESLVKIQLPKDIEEIGEGAFSGCKALTQFAIPKKNKKFRFKNGLLTDLSTGTLLRVFGQHDTIEIPSDIKKIGKEAFADSKIREIVIPHGVVSIGVGAFSNCRDLVSVKIGDSVNSIEEMAFYNCSKLTSVEIPESVSVIGYNVFQNCSELQSVVLPDKITKLPYDMFENCEKLTSIKIPESVKIIKSRAFAGCKNLETITLPDTLNEIEEAAFISCKKLVSIAIPQNVENIGKNAFAYCGLKEISLNGKFRSEVNKIGINEDCKIIFNDTAKTGWYKVDKEKLAFDYKVNGDKLIAYCGCDETVIIPRKIRVICDGAFKIKDNVYRSAIKEIVLNNKIEVIGKEAFYGCSELKKMYVPDSVKEIGDSAFENCLELEELSLPSKFKGNKFRLSVIGKCKVFYRGDDDLREICSPEDFDIDEGVLVGYKGKSVIPVIPEGLVYKIGKNAFREKEELISVVIPKGVKEIGKNAFFGCRSLEKVVFSEGLESIDGNAFMECFSLREINLPSTLKHINSTYRDEEGNTFCQPVFGMCSSLEKITVAEDNPVFYSKDNCIISREDKKLILGCQYSQIPYETISIGSCAFYGCEYLKKLKISYNVEEICDWAFYSCKNLEQIEMPYGIKKIGDHAFKCCFELRELYIPDGVEKLGSDVFWRCGNSINISLPNQFKERESELGEYAYGTVTVRETEEDISKFKESPIEDFEIKGNEIVKYKGNDQSVVIPRGKASEIGVHAFSDCTGIKKVVIPEGIKSLKYGSFRDCHSLEEVSFPEGLEEIGYGAFENCFRLKKVSLPKSLKRLGLCKYGLKKGESTFAEVIGIFANCSNIETLVIDFKNPYFSSKGNCITDIKNNVLVCGCKNTVIPSGVSEIAECAFVGCSGLEKIVIPSGVRTISNNAFFECFGLRDVEFPDTLVKIDGYAFAFCSNLEKIKLYDGLETISNEAFGDCSLLVSAILPESVKDVAYDAFEYSGLKRLMLPTIFEDEELLLPDDCEIIFKDVSVKKE